MLNCAMKRLSLILLSFVLYSFIPSFGQSRSEVIRLSRTECNDSKNKTVSPPMIKRVAFIESMPIQSFEADTIAIVEYFARYLSNYYSFYEYDTQLRSIYYGYCEVAIPFRMSEKHQLQIIRANLHINPPSNDFSPGSSSYDASRILELYFNPRTRQMIENCEVRFKKRLDNHFVFRIIVFVRKDDEYSVALFKNLGQVIP